MTQLRHRLQREVLSAARGFNDLISRADPQWSNASRNRTIGLA